MLLKFKSIILATGLLLSTVSLADTIELTDGSRLSGEIKSLNDGIYVINTSSLGQVRIEQSKVRTISKGQSTTNTLNGLSLDVIKHSITNNPDTLKTILALQNDPQVKAILADPELMKLISNGDLNALQSNQKIQQLMTSPEVQAITRQILIGQ
ncbi:hypothetical protein [Spartinivicinus ruber]|uniref:hypothetical protein n=1 Tax=Spartinivicinus ruber TaxID=2683272 RepID=UPI0013D67579|nr:hypothetical protein [Spartinivicinus ruber]